MLKGAAAAFAVVLALAGSAAPDESAAMELARVTFARYHREITGREAAADALSPTVDPSVSRTGNDAYVLKSRPGGVAVIGSNARSVLYGVYDLLARRGGCRWFWDGDVVPKREAIDLTGLDVREESRFAYRGMRYFAHRGLTRFQAEHWGFDAWKREIDWMVKSRLNLFMLRIGQDDLFQRAFPEDCAYPDPSRPIVGAGRFFDNRSLFWSLEFRGRLRERVLQYAAARGLLTPDDFGTMTHWYSRTPRDFLVNRRPPFLAQPDADFSTGDNLVWDVRTNGWLEAYWRLTETAGTYGGDNGGLYHTIGVGERRFSNDPAENFRMKVKVNRLLVDDAARRHPDAKILLGGWDFYVSWQPEEVCRFLGSLDPNRVILWDYEGDAYRTGKVPRGSWGSTDFTEWDVIGKFPYVFGVFLAYEPGLDIRANYELIRRRERLVADDPFCKGYVLWPESVHTDPLALAYFTRNAWRPEQTPTDVLVDDFCRARYGRQKSAFATVWRDVVPVSTNALPETWRSNYGLALLRHAAEGWRDFGKELQSFGNDAVFVRAASVFRRLGAVDIVDEFTHRDVVDLARTVGDRMALEAENRMMSGYFRWKRGDAAGAAAFARGHAEARRMADLMARLLAQHADFSLNVSLARLNAVEPVRNPDFGQVLLENAVNVYCASHQAEPAAHLYPQLLDAIAAEIRRRIAADDRSDLDIVAKRHLLEAFLKRPLASLAPTDLRTVENLRRVLTDLALAADAMFPPPVRPVTATDVSLVPLPRRLTFAGGFAETGLPVRVSFDRTLPREGYRLTVSTAGAAVVAADAAGAFYARQTLRQLGRGGRWPCCAVEDAPRYPWRGVHLDVSRHFFDKRQVMRFIDLAAEHKFNVFHWHLMDETGCRLPVRGYPRLATVGATRSAPDRRYVFDYEAGTYGPYVYSREDIREIVAYATERQMTVLPELEFPGHSREVIAAYPQLYCSDWQHFIEALTMEGSKPQLEGEPILSASTLCLGNDETLDFVDAVVDEVCGLFSGSYVHIGGDECSKVNWERCTKCRRRMRDLGLGDAKELQAWGVRHVVDRLRKKGRRAIGWEEVLQGGGLAKDALVMSWLGTEAGKTAAAAGHDVVMCPHLRCYLCYEQDFPNDNKYVKLPPGVKGNVLPIETVYGFDPCEGVPEGDRAHVLGSQAFAWSEEIPDEAHLDWKMWPRALAMAEVLWTGPRARSFEQFRRAARAVTDDLRGRGVNAAVNDDEE